MEVLRQPTPSGPEPGVVTAKLASMAILGGSALVCTLLPVFLARRCSTQANWINYLLRFGGGILLATTFLHLLPEVREGMEKIEDEVSWLKSSPVQVPELLMCLGFFLMYGVEEFAHKMLGHSHGPDSEKAVLHDEHHDHLYKSDPKKLFTTLEEIQREFLKLAEDPYVSSYESEEDVFSKDNIVLWKRKTSDGGTEHVNMKNIRPFIDKNEKYGANCADLNQVWTHGTPLRAILITMAISVHQLFEGLAVGLETHASQVWILTGAICAHKVVIALCVGAEISKAKKVGATVLVSVFTVATPLGIGMGLALTSQGPTMGLVSVILQGLACGTLLYVVFFEVLSKQEGAAPALGHFAITAFGFAVMLLLLYLFES